MAPIFLRTVSISELLNSGPRYEPFILSSIGCSRSFFNSLCHKPKAAPSAPPASPAAGCIHKFLNIFSLIIFPFATQFNATPPAMHKFLLSLSLDNDLTIRRTISSVADCIEAAMSI